MGRSLSETERTIDTNRDGKGERVKGKQEQNESLGRGGESQGKMNRESSTTRLRLRLDYHKPK